MVRVDRDLKRCYFYRIKIEGDVVKPMDQRSPSPEFPKSGIPRQDIIPYNPHFRERASRHTSRPSSTRRISWSREADRVREISPRSEPEPEPAKIFYPPPRKSNSFSEGYVDPEEKYPLTEKKKKKKKKKVPVSKPKSKPARKLTPEPVFQPVYIPPTTVKKGIPAKPKPKKKNDQLIRQHRDQRYRAQKLEQQSRKSQIPTSNLRKVKSETNLNFLRSVPKETLMKKAETGKTKHFNPPRWRHVGDRNRRRQGDKHSRSFASDYYF